MCLLFWLQQVEFRSYVVAAFVMAGEALSSYAGVAPSPGMMGGMYQRVEDPFATAYAPMQRGFGTGAAGSVQQAAGSQQHQHAPTAIPPAPPAVTAATVIPAAPHHDLV